MPHTGIAQEILDLRQSVTRQGMKEERSGYKGSDYTEIFSVEGKK